MQKKLRYLIPILLLILCLLVPSLLADRQAKNSSNGIANDPAAPSVIAKDTAGDIAALSAQSDIESNGNASAAPQVSNILGEDTRDTNVTVDAKETRETDDTEKTADAKDTRGNAEAGQVQNPVASNLGAASAKSGSNEKLNETLDEMVTVNIAVVGRNGQILFCPGSVKLAQGATAVDALAATGLVYTKSKRFPDLVESIAGFSNKGQAGWLYQVNGKVPLVAANKQHVSAEDRVVWWYSDSINAPVPSWEQLAK